MFFLTKHCSAATLILMSVDCVASQTTSIMKFLSFSLSKLAFVNSRELISACVAASRTWLLGSEDLMPWIIAVKIGLLCSVRTSASISWQIYPEKQILTRSQ